MTRESGARVRKADVVMPATALTAIVLFAGDTQLKWLRFLRQGFRHCLVAVSVGRAWVIIDPLSHKTALSVVEGLSAEELAEWFERQGMRAVRTFVRSAPAKLAPLAPATCVEAVKRVLGIHAWSVVTPRQLHDHLTADRTANLDIG